MMDKSVAKTGQQCQDKWAGHAGVHLLWAWDCKFERLLWNTVYVTKLHTGMFLCFMFTKTINWLTAPKPGSMVAHVTPHLNQNQALIFLNYIIPYTFTNKYYQTEIKDLSNHYHLFPNKHIMIMWIIIIMLVFIISYWNSSCLVIFLSNCYQKQCFFSWSTSSVLRFSHYVRKYLPAPKLTHYFLKNIL